MTSLNPITKLFLLWLNPAWDLDWIFPFLFQIFHIFNLRLYFLNLAVFLLNMNMEATHFNSYLVNVKFCFYPKKKLSILEPDSINAPGLQRWSLQNIKPKRIRSKFFAAKKFYGFPSKFHKQVFFFGHSPYNISCFIAYNLSCKFSISASVQGWCQLFKVIHSRREYQINIVWNIRSRLRRNKEIVAKKISNSWTYDKSFFNR